MSALKAGVALLVLAGFAGGAAAQVTTGSFTEIGRIESELARGVSTKVDVRRVLGAPKGVGGTVLPGDPRPREVWYYEDVETTNVRSESPGIIRGDTRQQIILIVFDREKLDGFVWYTAAGK